MKKRLFALTLVFCILLAPLTGCKNSGGEWVTEEEWVEVENEGSTGNNGSSNNDSQSQNGNQNKPNKRPTNQVTGKNPIITSMTGKDPNANYKVSGKVSVAVNTNRPTDYEALFEAFQAVYKDVELEIRYFSDGDKSLNYILKQASINKLPDVVFDDAASVPTYVAQGLAYPLDKFVKNDPDLKYVSNEILDTYRYGDKLFALPNSIHF